MPDNIFSAPTSNELNSALQKEQLDKSMEDRRLAQLKNLTPNTPPDEFLYIQEMGAKWNDDNLKFNEFMERAIEDKFPTGFLGGDMIDATIERGSLNSDHLSGITSDKLLDVIKKLAQISSITGAAFSSLGNNAGVVLNAHLNDPDPTVVLLAVAEITAYQTTAILANVIPWASNTLGLNYKAYYAADIQANVSYSTNPGRTMTYISYVFNQSGGAQDIVWRIRWRYLGRVI